MIAELTAALSALKETAGLVKVISDAKTDAEIKAATFELQNKLIALQADCFSLGDAIRTRDENMQALKAKVAEFEDFNSKTEEFMLNQTDAGTLVYSKHEKINGKEVMLHLCPKCYGERKYSLLQPIIVEQRNFFQQSKCIYCNIPFLMNKNPSYVKPPSAAQLGRKLNNW